MNARLPRLAVEMDRPYDGWTGGGFSNYILWEAGVGIGVLHPLGNPDSIGPCLWEFRFFADGHTLNVGPVQFIGEAQKLLALVFEHERKMGPPKTQ